ncbi:MAG TPA: PhoH family protein [Thermoanaerobaculia bacterium]|nr:PhoH family protein [Thermoanaerobaculia bacterium]
MRQITLAEEGLDTLFGVHDENLGRIEQAFGVRLSARGNVVAVEGEPAAAAMVERLLEQLSELLRAGHRFRGHEIQTAIRVLREDPEASLAQFFSGEGLLATVRRVASPRSLNQQRYLQAMLEHDMVVAIGPAGTGKTYLAVAMAAAAMAEQQVRRIILCRPAVEAGEKLGFLPGDLAEKVNPYLRPLYDSLYDLIGFDKVSRMLEKGVIEVAPLAFMRGRTLNDSFIIMDEAQNTTSEQMKMFLTRIGFGSKAVINGDLTQVDLPPGKVPGLREAETVLTGVEGISFIYFTDRDVVRHPLVQKIVAAYDRHDRRRQEGLAAARTEAEPVGSGSR